MEKIIYFDNFSKKYTKTKVMISPPERYIEIFNSHNNFYKEVWQCKENVRLSIAYSEGEMKYTFGNVIRKQKAEENNVVLDRLIRWYVPNWLYQEIIKKL